MPAREGGTEGPLWPVCRLEQNDRTERGQECLLLALGQQKIHYFLIMGGAWRALSLSFCYTIGQPLLPFHPLGLFKSMRKYTRRETKPPSTVFL